MRLFILSNELFSRVPTACSFAACLPACLFAAYVHAYLFCTLSATLSCRSGEDQAIIPHGQGHALQSVPRLLQRVRPARAVGQVSHGPPRIFLK